MGGGTALSGGSPAQVADRETSEKTRERVSAFIGMLLRVTSSIRIGPRCERARRPPWNFAPMAATGPVRWQDATPRGASRIQGMPGPRGIVATGHLWPRKPGAKDSPVSKAPPILTPLALLVGFGCTGLGVATAADPQRRLP